MKKGISILIIIAFLLNFCSMGTLAADNLVSKIVLQKAEYYSAVETEDKLYDAVLSIDFTAILTDGTKLIYTTKDGWSNGANYEVSACIRNEVDENFGAQQSLYIVIDGQEFWAAYTNVEVNPAKAIFRKIVTWNDSTPEEKVTIITLFSTFLAKFLMMIERIVNAIRLAT